MDERLHAQASCCLAWPAHAARPHTPTMMLSRPSSLIILRAGRLHHGDACYHTHHRQCHRQLQVGSGGARRRPLRVLSPSICCAAASWPRGTSAEKRLHMPRSWCVHRSPCAGPSESQSLPSPRHPLHSVTASAANSTCAGLPCARYQWELTCVVAGANVSYGTATGLTTTFTTQPRQGAWNIDTTGLTAPRSCLLTLAAFDLDNDTASTAQAFMVRARSRINSGRGGGGCTHPWNHGRTGIDRCSARAHAQPLHVRMLARVALSAFGF